MTILSIADLPLILFVPGNRPERFDKAMQSGAPAIVIDLEDAVANDGKDAARAHVHAWFTQRGTSTGAALAGIRLNSPYSQHGVKDLARLLDRSIRPDFLVLPKVESEFEALLAHRLSGGVPLVCIIESALGLSRAVSIAHGAPSVAALGFGGADLAADLRAEFSWDALLPARGVVVQAAASAGIGAIDVPYLDLRDEAGIAAECARARALGFTGKFAIHPRHVAPVLAAFIPNAEAARRAIAILEAAARSGGDAVEFEGRMIDEAVLRSARRTVALSQSQTKEGI